MSDDGLITIQDFRKVDLRVAEVLRAERVEGADKLLRLEVGLGGDETRQLVAGVAPWYEPEELVGRKIVVVYNLEPATIRGVESQGMLLAAGAPGDAMVAILSPIRDVPAGTRVS